MTLLRLLSGAAPALAAAALLASPALAAAAEEPEEDAAVLPAEPLEVTIRAKAKEPDTYLSSRAAARVTQDEIADAAPQSLADALRFKAGVGVQQTTPGQSTVYVRGLSGREVMHLVDGIPLNTSIFRAGNNPYLGLVDPYAVEEIEVIRGASSVLHGSDALAGVVSVQTRLPRYSLVPGGSTRAHAFQSFSTNPMGTASRVSAEHSASSWAAHLGLTHYQSGDIRPGDGQRSPVPSSYPNLERTAGGAYRPETSDLEVGTAFETYAADGSLRRRLSERTEVILRGQVAYRPELSRYDEITPRFKANAPSRAESVLSPFYRTMVSTSVVHRPASSWIDGGVVAVWWQRLHEEPRRRNLSETCFVGGLEADVDASECDGVLRLVPRSSADRETNQSDVVGLRAELRVADENRRAGGRIGFDVSRDVVTSEADSLDLTTLEVTPEPERFPSGSSMTQAGLFGELEVEPVPGLRLHAGARGAFFGLDIPEREVPGGSASPAFDKTLFDAAFGAGSRWELVRGVSWVVNAGRGVRSPNVQDFSALGARAKGRFQLPNPDVRPEHSLSLDTGLKLLRGRVRAESYVFYLRYEDAIALAPTTLNGASENAAGEKYERSENAAYIEYHGTESELELTITDEVGVRASALVMMGTQHSDEKLGLPVETPADRTPPPTGAASVWVDAIPALRLELSARGRLAQRRLNDPVNLDDNRIPEGGTPGFATYHLHATWRARKGMIARLALDNFTDNLVLEHGSGFYRAGASATGSLDLTF